MTAPRRPALLTPRLRPGMRLPPVADAAPRPARMRIVEQTGDDPAELWLYDAIGEDFFGFGINAETLCRDIAALAADEILLRVNSPGGDYFDGIAIYNALVQHPARVVAQVDGLAASAASFIVQAASRVVMGRGARVMIHDALGVCVGNAADMQAMTETLDSISADIADLYHAHAGGGAKAWRDKMRAETWYSADESVSAGLADAVMPAPKKRGQDSGEQAAAAVDWSVAAAWDLSSIFRYPDSAAAPAAAAGRERIVASAAPEPVGEVGPELVGVPAGAVVEAAPPAEDPADPDPPAAQPAGDPEPVVVPESAADDETSADPAEIAATAATGPVAGPDPEPVEPDPAPEPQPEPEPVPVLAAAFPGSRPAAAQPDPEPAPDPWAALTEHLTVSRPATVDDLLAELRKDTG